MVLDGPQIGWTYDGEEFKPPFYEYNWHCPVLLIYYFKRK
jgi:hypothetical protein